MKNSADYLREALGKLGESSDAQKARQLEIAKSTLSLYLSGTRVMDNFACVKVAQVLQIDPMIVIAAASADRDKTPERREFWEGFRKQFGKMALAGLLAMPIAEALRGAGCVVGGILTLPL